VKLKIRAAVLEGVGSQFEVAELDLAAPKAGEVLVKIAASGLCASDLNAIDGKRKLGPFPAVIGHEAAGVVIEVGPDVTSPKVGDHVILSIVPHCGTCSYCKEGRPNYCSTAGDAMGVGGMFDGTSRLSRNGEKVNQFLTVASFAEYSVVPVSGCVVIPKEMPLDRAALISCAVLTGYGAVANTAKVEAGSRVSVFGCGGVGLNIQAAQVVILMEPQLKPSTENQAIARVYRMGQSRNVMVHRLIAEDSIDEDMVRLIAKKQQIFDCDCDPSTFLKQHEYTKKYLKIL
jgi:S-(hydroxymethyl)glutathione dehydrogenase/alcohol dehydrogenase